MKPIVAFLLVICLAAGVMSSLHAQSNDVKKDEGVVKSDRGALSSEKRNLAHDRHDVAIDKRNLRAEHREHNKQGVARATKTLESDMSTENKARHQVLTDRAVLRVDKKDLHRDIRAARHKKR
jgi:hypothetical protein